MTSLLDRLMSKVVWNGDVDECWEWEGAGRDGYGRLSVEGKLVGAHRVAYELFNGPIPDGDGYHGVCVLHTCDNRRCCNPSHLKLGTQTDNLADMRAKGRHRQPRLTRAEAAEIRQRYAGRYGEQTALAREYGVSRRDIYRALRGGER